MLFYFFFFQAEDGIRDHCVTGVQTCALPILKADAAINPNGLLPAKLGYYRYTGSLTTPPCSEVVEWLVLTQPMQVAASDVEIGRASCRERVEIAGVGGA